MDDHHLPDGVLSTEGHAQRIKPPPTRPLARGDRVRVTGPEEAAYLGMVTGTDGDRAFVYDARLNVVAPVPLSWVAVVEPAPKCCPTCGREVTHV